MVDPKLELERRTEGPLAGLSPRERELHETLSLFFLGNRLHTVAPDRVLGERGLHRAHHRVLYFVARNPGINVSGLLGILGISKQALHGPLKRLVDMGLVEACVSPSDSRTKELRLTPEGAAFEAQVSGAEREQFARVFVEVGPDDEAAWRRVMDAIIRINSDE